jgi:hypothetical protein
MTDAAIAQRTNTLGTIAAGTTLTVRTVETIDEDDSDGRVYEGVVVDDVRNRSGFVAIPQGSTVEMVVKKISDNELALDLDAVIINNLRYSIAAAGTTVAEEKRDGIGINERTGKYVGGGAVLGAIIGAIAGGKKGAAIGAGAGAAAGAGTQVLTRAKSVEIPAESLLTFRLQQQLQPVVDAGYSRNGKHYHPGYQSGHITGLPAADPDDIDIRIGRDNFIRWHALETVRIYVMMDNQPLKLFAEGQTGTQAAHWIEPGHVYVFIMQDLSGKEIARDRLDLRYNR